MKFNSKYSLIHFGTVGNVEFIDFLLSGDSIKSWPQWGHSHWDRWVDSIGLGVSILVSIFVFISWINWLIVIWEFIAKEDCNTRRDKFL